MDQIPDATRIVARIAAIAFASIRDVITIAPDGTLGLTRTFVDRDHMAAVETFEVTDRPVSARRGGGRVRCLRIRLAGKLAALDMLSRHLGLFGARSGTPVAQAIGLPRFGGAGPTAARRERRIAEALREGAIFGPPHADPGMRAAVETARHRLARRLAISAERVLEEYARIARASEAGFVAIDDGGVERLDLAGVRPEHWAGLCELVVTQHIDRSDGLPPVVRSWRLKFVSPQRAIDKLAKHRALPRKHELMLPEERARPT